MKTLIATLIAGAVGASFAIAPASAAPVDKEAHRAALDKAAADYRTAKAKCDAMKGHAEEVCEDEAKLAQARAEHAAYAKYDTTGGNLRDVRSRVVQAEFELASTQCDPLEGDAETRCKNAANANRDKAMANLDRERGSGSAANSGLVASTSTTNPVKAQAVEKCEQVSGDARTACLVDERGHVTTAAAVASSAGSKIAENTREAMATVKEKTAAAVDRTREMASNAADRTGEAAERAGDRTTRVASDGRITAKVKAGLVSHPDLKGTDITVDTDGGVVMLSGFVESKAEADKAATVAKSVDGVTSVKNSLKVK